MHLRPLFVVLLALAFAAPASAQQVNGYSGQAAPPGTLQMGCDDGSGVMWTASPTHPCPMQDPGTATGNGILSQILTALGAPFQSGGSIGNTQFGSTQSGAWNVGGLTGVNQTATLTRVSNTTTYSANTLVCAFASTTPCAPLQLTIAGTAGATGTIGRVFLAKSTTQLTNATFTLWLFSAAPTTTGLFDDSAYVGPYAADLPNYLGSLTCNAMQATNDGTAQAFSECTPNTPSGWLQYQTVSGQTYVDALITVTAAYAPGSAETFKPYVSSLRDK